MKLDSSISLEILTQIKNAAGWSKASYLPKELVPNYLLISDSKTDCQVLVIEEESQYVISFRGSESIKDWIGNMKVSQTPFLLGAKVHLGFMHQYSSVKEQILQKISEQPEKSIMCCGHSLGGALATICSLDLVLMEKRKCVSCITFGSPRAGDIKFKELFDTNIKNSYRIKNSYDFVTHLPFRFRFRHVNNLIGISSPFHFNIVRYHSMDTYKKKIRNKYFRRLKKLNRL